MKVKVLSRSEEKDTKETSTDIVKSHKNLDPNLHPLERPREYMRALNSVKIDKLFAKPFVASLTGHHDGIFTMRRHHNTINCFASGACDGEVKIWNLTTLSERSTIKAHEGYVRGLSFSWEENKLFTCGEDQTVKIWKLDPIDHQCDGEVVSVFRGKHSFTSVDCQRYTNTFATSGINVEIWDANRASPMQTLSWGHASVSRVRFNPIETHVLASCTSDREVILYDTRQQSPAQKLITQMRSNSIAWNPQISHMLALANEDENAYQYDIRKLNKAMSVHRDHVGAVLDVDYAPTGREIVTGSYDKTIRIFTNEQYNSREVYFTNRMQRIFSVLYTGDANFVLSGSDDMNIRVWKANATAMLGPLSSKQFSDKNYKEKLQEKFSEIPQLKTIKDHRRVPKAIYKKRYVKNVVHVSKERREEKQRKFSKQNLGPKKKLLSQHTITVEK
ncbi:hypothetical protein DFA_07486 [Cavenderia fasciculata]|uniref:Sof1-like protein domain-containing protein n=1 Tax=Cavenderia fasciculata TaxID=261658 RepID=F4PWJ8_CACFS|nr:uncharacterized protein DFA_07486 [Cavenderia fasciculata]EGG20362.1 hypothetical protein DFA_07486 [Cavenderia fasciculata]|eukprot:XP_004367345.1 hypothetical protein DFA_07486 [Cavenderia fasciculata]